MSIQIIMLIVIGVIMIASLLIGLWEGFRKNMFNFFATLIFWIIFWITAPLIQGRLIWYNNALYDALKDILPSVENDGASILCLMDYLKATIANAAGFDALSDPNVSATIVAIAQCVLKIVWLIIWAIIYFFAKIIVYNCFFKKYCRVSKRHLKKLEKKQAKYFEKHHMASVKIDKEIR